MSDSMRFKSITIADIAKQINLSMATIDRVLNNRGGVAEETRERVLQAVKQLNYSPNRGAKHLAKRTQCCIGISYLFPDWFGEQVNQGIQQAFIRLKDLGLRIIVRNTARTTEEQIEQIKEILPELDGLILAPREPAKFHDFVDEQVDLGLPVVTFNNDIPTSKRLFHVGCDYITAGRLCGEIMAKIVKKSGKIGIIIRNENLTNIEQRITGFRNFISNHHDLDLRIIGPFKIPNIKEEISSQIKSIFDNNIDIVGLFVPSDTLALVGYALKDLGKAKKIKLIGYDLNSDHYNLIKEEVIHAVVCQEPFCQGYYPIKILFDYITEKIWPTSSEIITRLEIIMRENVDFYYNYIPILDNK